MGRPPRCGGGFEWPGQAHTPMRPRLMSKSLPLSDNRRVNHGYWIGAAAYRIKRRFLAMPNRVLAAMLLLVALGSATATTARAQSVADADHTLRAMDLRMRALHSARKNLQEMERHRDDREADAVREITDADTSAFTAAVKVFTVAFFITHMKCADDVLFSQQQFGLVVKLFISTADEQIPRVNENLRNVAAPAAVAEGTTIRDAIVDLREFLKPFATAR
jgi:hypothetical protein